MIGEIAAEHRADALEHHGDAGRLRRRLHPRFELSTPFLQLFIPPTRLEFFERGQPCRHRQRISTQRARLIHRTERRESIHDLGAPTEGADGQSSSDDFSKTGEIFENGRSRWEFSAAHTRQSVEQSLRSLRTDRLDVVLLHCPVDDLAAITDSPALETLAQLRADGKIRALGVSVMSLAGGLAAVPLSDVVMVSWNTGFRDHEPVIHAAANKGVGIVLKKVLSSGHLPSDGAGGLTPLEYSLRSAMALPGNPVIITGTLSPGHLRQNVAAVQGEPQVIAICAEDSCPP